MIKKLHKFGYLSQENNTVLLTSTAEQLFTTWKDFLIQQLKPFYENIYLAPTFISSDILKNTGYIKNFPNQLFRSNHYINNHSTKDYLLAPAACHHVYPLYEHKKLSSTGKMLIFAQCARTEDGKTVSPFRLSEFHMLEVLTIGSRPYLEKLREDMEKSVLSIFRQMFDLQLKVSTDSFYMGKDSGARLLQKMKQLKKEFTISFKNTKIAIGSINNHEDYFTNRFNIQLTDKFRPYSFCLAFGLERLTALGLLKWGENVKNWPKQLQNV